MPFCLVRGCGSKSLRDALSFYRIPSKFSQGRKESELLRERRSMWISALKRNDLTESKVKFGRICSKHFITGKPAKCDDKSNPDWIPTQNMERKSSTQASGTSLSRYNRVKRKEETSEINLKTGLEHDFDSNIVKEEIKLEPCLDNIKSEFDDDILYNIEHPFDETITMNQNQEWNVRGQTTDIENTARKTDEIKVETVVKVKQNTNKEKRLACDVCEFRTAYRTSLRTHKDMHLGKMPFVCNVCDFRSIRKSDLETHVKIHTGEKPFACDLCNYKSITKRHLKDHMKIHTGEKPFACNLCEFKSTYKNNLKNHMMIHSGSKKPFACSFCEFKTANKGNLRRHLLIHTGEKRFVCHLCEFRCVRKDVLKNHMNTHTIK